MGKKKASHSSRRARRPSVNRSEILRLRPACAPSNRLSFNSAILTDTELSTYSRTLYGGRFVYQSLSRSKYGQPDTEVVLFGADVQQVHSEMQRLD